MLKIILLSVVLGFLATWFSSPRFLRCHLTLKNKRIVFRDWKELKKEPFWDYNSYLTSQTIAFFATTFCSFILLLLLSRGVSLFSGGILGSLLVAYFFKLIYKPSDAFLSDTDTKKVLSFWKVGVLIYLLLFVVDNVQFRLASVPEKYTEVNIEEVLSNEEFYVSSLEDFVNQVTIQKVYYINGKYIVYSGSHCHILVIENNKVTTIHYPRVGSGATFLSIPSPIDLRAKNIKDIGVTVDDEYNPYFVYVSFKQEHFLGKYSIDQFILLNPYDKDNLHYYDKLPDFAKP